MSIINKNPAKKLVPVRKVRSNLNKPISKETVVKLLKSFNRKTWIGERDFIIVSILWALGLRVHEMTKLKIGSFKADFDKEKKIGLLRIQGKGRKERSLFVVDKLYENLNSYLNLYQTPTK